MFEISYQKQLIRYRCLKTANIQVCSRVGLELQGFNPEGVNQNEQHTHTHTHTNNNNKLPGLLITKPAMELEGRPKTTVTE